MRGNPGYCSVLFSTPPRADRNDGYFFVAIKALQKRSI
jgi:hypothetical protein